jgi:hypothetical protein
MDFQKTWKVAREDSGKHRHAFDVTRLDDGGIRITNVDALSDAERFRIMSHFGSKLSGRDGHEDKSGRMIETWTTLDPGTEEHFTRAIYQLPHPFIRQSDHLLEVA